MKLLASSVRPCTASLQIKLFVVFAISYCIATQYLRAISSRDPSSFFFDAKRAYQRRYSLTRIEEASDFIATATKNGGHVKASSNPSICVGIATVQRNDAEYFDLLVGSLLDGLTDAERSDILLLPFIANIDPHTHYAFNTSWLPNLSDEVITYENVSAGDKARMRSQETPKGHMKKALFDYSFMLSTLR